MNQQFLTAVKEWVAARGSVNELLQHVRAHKDAGLSQSDAYATLEHVLAAAPDDEIDDRLRDVMDFVSGWCSPHARIWPEPKL
ncbi:MAG TPA: hypothetical protein VIV11_31130 [Kofleriaceae bacterium]